MTKSDAQTLADVKWYFSTHAAREEIGEKPYKRMMGTVIRHYEDQWNDQILFRAAPSIVCRSEIEVLGIAAPRFAFRAIFHYDDVVGLLNCRRTRVLQRELSEAIPETWDCDTQTMTSIDKDDLARVASVLADWIERSSPVAESILPTPRRWRDFYVMSRDYGELFAEDKTIRGTPFMNVTALGGGLCSQGACFLASLHRIDDARFIHAPSEITALLRNPQEGGVLEIDGLRNQEILNYFRHAKVGLNAYLEIGMLPASPIDYSSQDRERLTATLDLLAALRSYILSDVPVIALVDANTYCERVLGNDVNRIKVQSVGGKSNNHCIVLIGTHKARHSTRFLAQDATASPWIELTAEELLECRASSGKPDFAALNLIPVLPQGVRMHLLTSQVDSYGNTVGLFKILAQLHRDRSAAAKIFPGLPPDLPRAHSHASFLPCVLVDLDLVRSGNLAKARRHWQEEDALFLSRLAETGLSQRRWVWTQRLEHAGEPYAHSWWFWNAEGQAEAAFHDVTQVLDLVAIRSDKHGWIVHWSSRSQDSSRSMATSTASEPERDLAPSRDLKLSVITSFLPTSIRSAFRFWPAPAGCELYGFMLKDVSYVRKFSRPTDRSPRIWRESSGDLNLHGLLSKIALDKDCVERLANQLDHDARECGTTFVAIASFIPELSNPPASRSAKLACGALNCLCKLALALRRLGHPLATVEFVCGSRVVGVNWETLRKNPDSSYLPIVIESRSRLIQWTVDQLVAATADCRQEMRERGICLALELEPGELFVAQDLGAVEELLETAALRGLDVLALNLDIGHFRMAEHLAENAASWQDSFAKLTSKFAHCHASSHSKKGHFADGPLTDAVVQDMAHWLDIYHAACEQRTLVGLPATRYVSVELEAAADPSLVQRSAGCLSARLTSF